MLGDEQYEELVDLRRQVEYLTLENEHLKELLAEALNRYTENY